VHQKSYNLVEAILKKLIIEELYTYRIKGNLNALSIRIIQY